MKAIVQAGYGPAGRVLRLAEVPTPAPGAQEVLVRVRATGVSPDVWHAINGVPYVLRLMGAGVRGPRIATPGIDLAGVVEAVGAGVTRFAPGDEVFGDACGFFQWKNAGTFAEYAVVPAKDLEPKPEGVSFEQAAASVTPGLIALLNLRLAGEVKGGHEVLINGAGGNVGSAAIQLVNAWGARVTGVDCGAKLELMRELGADHVIDYRRTDFWAEESRYDVILDVASTLELRQARRALVAGGSYVRIGHDHFGKRNGRLLGSMPRALLEVATAPFVKNLPGLRHQKQAEAGAKLEVLRTLLEDGRLRPRVARTFPLEQAVEALRSMEEGEVAGAIVVTPT